jgi:hypothetical protein
MIRKIEAHPDAAIFPMMDADELASLAADIKANGQRFPIVIGKFEDREVIVDGRNRFEACQIAEVEPKFEQLNGHDPKAFILSVNIKRRHMTAGQRAMATAMIYPHPQKELGRGKKSSLNEDFSAASLSNARTVLRFSRPVAESVLAGTKTLGEALKESDLGTGNIKNDAARIRALHAERPDLASRVNDGELTLDVAISLAKAELAARNQQRWAATKSIVEILQLFDRTPETAEEVVGEIDHSVAEKMGETITPERLLQASAFLSAFAAALDKSLNPELETA